jgi:hypothetical protein
MLKFLPNFNSNFTVKVGGVASSMITLSLQRITIPAEFVIDVLPNVAAGALEELQIKIIFLPRKNIVDPHI